MHVHQHGHGRVRLARHRVQLDVVGGEKDGLVLLPRLLLVEHIVDSVGGMRPVDDDEKSRPRMDGLYREKEIREADAGDSALASRSFN